MAMALQMSMVGAMEEGEAKMDTAGAQVSGASRTRYLLRTR